MYIYFVREVLFITDCEDNLGPSYIFITIIFIYKYALI